MVKFTPEWWCVKWMAPTVLKAQVGQIGQNAKNWTVSAQGQSHTLFITSQSIWWKEAKVILLGVFFYGELHDHYQNF